ncbi:MAG: DNA phosphorothioation system sulfurtransferase DndC, partial [bacterium]|nr:DNA phosphorothioation system sulfurtransferase DndC [bacterium]
MVFNTIIEDIKDAYLGDTLPWVIGFSGGKDSTALLELIFRALSSLPKSKKTKPLHVLCNDTLVENPAILEYVETQL